MYTFSIIIFILYFISIQYIYIEYTDKFTRTGSSTKHSMDYSSTVRKLVIVRYGINYEENGK